MGPQHSVQHMRDSCLKTVPPRVERVERDDLDTTRERPPPRQSCRQRGLSGTASPIDEHDGIRRSESTDVLLDQCRSTLQSERDGVVTS